MVQPTISRLDFCIFALPLAVPAFIAIYFGLIRKQKDNNAYLVGNRSLSALPMSFSLALSFLTTTIVSAIPGDVAYFGTVGPWTMMISSLFGGMIVMLLIPIFYKMKLNSVYEYLELRYQSQLVRQLGSLTFILSMTAHLGFVLYLPSETLGNITGLPPYAFVVIIGMVATLYTIMGGVQAIMWSDVFQFIMVVSSLLTIVAKAIDQKTGGLAEVWHIGVSSQRINWANLDPSPFAKTTTWIVLFGNTILWTTRFGCHQSQVQKFCSVMSLSQARWTVALAIFLFWMVQGSATLAGLAIYSNVWNCDPVANGSIENPNELTINYVINQLRQLPGLLGLLMASLMAATLGTLTSGIHSLSAVVWEDLLFQFPQFQASNEKQQLEITRTISGIMGILAIGLSFFCLHQDVMVTVGSLALGVVAGPLAAIFLLGFFTATTNKFGCFCGFVAANGVTIWLLIGSVLWDDKIKLTQEKSSSFDTLDTFDFGCIESEVNQSSTIDEIFAKHATSSNEFFYIPNGDWEIVLYSTNPTLYPFIGFLICLISSLIVSLLTHLCFQQKPVEQLLLHPWARFKEEKEMGGSLLLKQAHQRHYISANLADKGLYNEAWQMDDPMDTHYRWPSPSLPPTLKKKNKALLGRGNNINNALDPKLEDSSYPKQDPSSSEGEMSQQSLATSKEEFSHTPTTMSSIHGFVPHKTFSRQHVINACEAACVGDTDDKSSCRSSSYAQNDLDEILSCSSSLELDAFGDVVPVHLRKQKVKKATKTKNEEKSADPPSTNVSQEKNADVEEEEEGWTTDF